MDLEHEESKAKRQGFFAIGASVGAFASVMPSAVGAIIDRSPPPSSFIVWSAFAVCAVATCIGTSAAIRLSQLRRAHQQVVERLTGPT